MTRTAFLRLILLAGLLSGLISAALPAAAQEATLVIESTPEAAALYRGDLAYLRDEVTLPAGVNARILLPPTTLRESLVVTEAGRPLPHYRLTTASELGTLALLLETAPGDEARTFTLAYLASGAGWSPRYDLDVLDTDSVNLSFSAEITNYALPLQDADIRLVAGMPGADPNYRPAMTVTQMNTLYNAAEAPVTSGGPVAINHVYPLGPQTLNPGETLYWNLFAGDLEARRLIVWDARFGQRTDVIYKVRNSSEIPFVEGSVHAYEDGLFVGQDDIEWTPPASEGNVTIGGLSTIRVRRTESVEQIGTFNNDRYRHEVTLAITNHGSEDISLTVLDEWNRSGQDYEFSLEPTRQGNNVLRWEPVIPAGDTLEITITFIID